MAWVRFRDGSRRKAERIDEAQAEQDLAELLRQRDEAQLPGARRTRRATFDEAIVSWIERTYHRRRRQPALGRLTPVGYEMINTPQAAQAA
jgi:transposase InsO family protein